MARLTIASLKELAAKSKSVTLHHGTDVLSALAIERSGLDAGHAQRLGGSGDFWATDDRSEAEWFAEVNPANGQPARLVFELDATVLLRLISAKPAGVQLHENDGIEFFASSFHVLNLHLRQKHVMVLP